MTKQETSTEWDYIYQERLGIACGAAEPSEAQAVTAMQQADEHIERLES
jgi:hypothetical protein